MASAPNTDSAIRSVLSARDALLKNMNQAAAKLDGIRETIKDAAYGRALTPDEQSKIAEINAAMGSLLAAHRDLVLMTYISLGRSDEVTRLRNLVDGISNDLKTRTEKVSQVVKNLAEFAKIVNGVSAVLTNLGKLAAVVA